MKTRFSEENRTKSRIEEEFGQNSGPQRGIGPNSSPATSLSLRTSFFLLCPKFRGFGWGLIGGSLGDVGPATTQNLVVKFDGEICGGVLVENASDDFPSKRSSKISCQTSLEVRHEFRRKLCQLHSGNRWCLEMRLDSLNRDMFKPFRSHNGLLGWVFGCVPETLHRF